MKRSEESKSKKVREDMEGGNEALPLPCCSHQVVACHMDAEKLHIPFEYPKFLSLTSCF
jgi:hypothetical protein